MSEARENEVGFTAGSTLLQDLQDAVPSGHFTLQWIISRLGRQSYPSIVLLLAIMAAFPGISLPAGLLLLVPTLQMIAGRPAPIFPRWLASRPIPSRMLSTSLGRAMPILKVLEKAIHPRWPTALAAGKSVIGVIILLLTVRLLAWPLPLSNVLPAAVIGAVALSWLEQDGLMLLLALMSGLIVLAVDAKVFYELMQVALHFWAAISP